jgi:hypothetical protein
MGEREMIQKSYRLPGTVTHIYNPNFSGERNQKDCSFRPAQEKSW